MKKGKLFVVATPIGNLGDISHRAAETLSQVSVIAAEDTRVTKKLLAHLGLATPCLALHDHNERELVPKLVERLNRGESVALVSDAGTPLISDPGYLLISAAHVAEIPLVAIPGPSALAAALSVAGLPVDRFVFEGFLPPKAGERQKRLRELTDEPRTVVFYESSHRIVAMLEDVAAIFGTERPVALAHELTKIHESVERGTVSDVLAWLAADANRCKGEFVVVVGGAPAALREPQDDADILRALLEFLPLSQAVAAAVKITGQKRNVLYAQAIELQKSAN